MALFDDLLRSALGDEASDAPSRSRGLVEGLVSMLQQSGGIEGLAKMFEQRGLGAEARSWIGTGANQPVTPSALSDALGGTGALDSLAQSTGMSQEDVAAQLSEGLPELIDRLTPHGHVPAQE